MSAVVIIIVDYDDVDVVTTKQCKSNTVDSAGSIV